MRNDIENPRPDARYLTIVVAGMLGFGLAGNLLLHALDAPSDPLRWVMLGVWIMVWVAATTYAYRRWYRSRRAQSTAEEEQGAGSNASTHTTTGSD